MADKDHTRARRDAAPEIFDKTFLCFDGSGNRLIDISKSALSRKKAATSDPWLHTHGLLRVLRRPCPAQANARRC